MIKFVWINIHHMGKRKVPERQPRAFFTIIDQFLEKHLSKFFTLSILLTAILGFYLFQLRISEGGDDSFYIESAKKFLDGTEWPGWHGPFYPIFLSWLMAIFGFKLFIFKFSSYLFLIGSQVFFYETFRKRVPSTVLVVALLLMSVSPELLYFGSQTYTEALYLFLQSILFFMVIRYYLEIEDQPKLIFQNWWIVLIVGGILFLMAITRNIGIVALGVCILYLLLEKKFFLAGYTLIGFLIFRLPFSLYKKLAWGVTAANMSGQLNEVLLKNPYNPGLGSENFKGMIDRFLDNSDIYLSRLIMIASGLRSSDYSGTSALITILLYLLFAVAIYMAFRRNKVMKFTGIYLGLAIAATFVALQQQWGQMRMIIIYVPLIFLFLPWGMLELAGAKKLRWMQPVLVLLLFVMFFRLFGISVNKAKANNEILMKNIRGDKYYGYTPDWINFLRLSEWAAKNVPEESMIASRKPSMSFIYGGGRSFYPIFRIPTLPGDSVFVRMEEKPGEPVILNEVELRSWGLPRQLEYSMKRELDAFVACDDTMYSVYYFSDLTKPGYLEYLRQHNLHFESSLETLRNKIAASGSPGIAVVPDSLVNALLRNHVDYIIMGSLRLNPAQKTNRVINTVHRYMYYIEQKYPGIFKQVTQVGGNNDEPAQLFQIQWSLYGLDAREGKSP